eukprot:COSAG02_NODE_23126_length_729_cov_1.120635_1_plen_58_part_10
MSEEDVLGIDRLELDDGSQGEDPPAPDRAAPSMTPQFSFTPTLEHEGAGFAAFDMAET